MQRRSAAVRAEGRRIVLVPTMGALHEGHMSLVDEARRHGDFVVVSIFVNPIQFGPGEDLERYPRTLEADCTRCRAHGVDAVFAPASDRFYAADFSTYVDESLCSRGLCGEFRPGHFRGVATVVTMLFNLVAPHTAIFGAKDAQQCGVIRKMVADLYMPVEVIVADTVRESDGLALSSRNRYLPEADRAKAPALYRCLLAAKAAVEAGECDASTISALFARELEREGGFRIQYFTLSDARTMAPVDRIVPGGTLAVVAVYLGDVRLIDNLLI